MTRSLSGHELVGSVEELAAGVVSSVVCDLKFKNIERQVVIGPLVSKQVIEALLAEGFVITRPTGDTP